MNDTELIEAILQAVNDSIEPPTGGWVATDVVLGRVHVGVVNRAKPLTRERLERALTRYRVHQVTQRFSI